MKKNLTPDHIVSFILHFSAVVFAGFGIFGLFILIFLDKKIGPTYAQGVSTLIWLDTNLPLIIFLTAFVQALTICVIVTFIALVWSHAISGPLVRFRKILKNISLGRFIKEPLVFRTNDQLHILAQAFSEMATANKDMSVKALALLIDAQKIIDECKALKNQRNDSNLYGQKFNELKKIYQTIKDIYSL